MGNKEIKIGKVECYLSSNVNGGPADAKKWYEEEFPLPYQISKQDDITIPSTSVGYEKIKEEIVQLTLSKKINGNEVKMRGLGTSLDTASVFHLMNMSVEQRGNFLRTLIDPNEGSGFTQFRLVIGTSDLNAKEQDLYSYYDEVPEGVPNWEENFTIKRDVDMGLVKIIKEIYEIASEFNIEKDIQFLASPWSPPGWMKEDFANIEPVNNDLKLIGGSLKDDYVKDWAIYLRRYLEEYAKLNIPIHSLTLQNEPTLINRTYPSAIQLGYQQAEVARCLREEIKNSVILQEKGYYTELWAWDYGTGLVNSEQTKPAEFFESLESRDPGLSLFDGIAFHAYNYDTLWDIKAFSERYPDKTIQITEGMETGTFELNRIMIHLRQNCSSFYHWVTCLDQDGKPNEWDNSAHMSGWKEFGNVALAIYNGDKYWFLPTKNLMGQISRFVRPGAVMLDIKESVETQGFNYEGIAYQDLENNNIILVLSNNTMKDIEFSVRTPNQHDFKVIVPFKTAGTYIYSVNS